MATADSSKPARLEDKSLAPEETKPAAPTDEVKLVLAHHWTDGEGKNHAPNSTVTLPTSLARSLAAQGWGRIGK